MNKEEQIRIAEQTWLVLLDFFGDLNRKGIKIEIASELRLCRNLIQLINTTTTAKEKYLQELQERLEKAKTELILEASKVGKDYIENWLQEFNKASRGELQREIKSIKARFAPNLPRDPSEGWVRLTLLEPINEEYVEEIVEHFGVLIEFQDDFHLTICGKKESVKKAIQELKDCCTPSRTG